MTVTLEIFIYDIPQYAEADFPIFVQIWIKSDLVIPCCHELYPRCSDWIIWWTANHKVEESSLIWSIKWSCYQSMDLEINCQSAYSDSNTCMVHVLTCM